jgi:pimeloyl-ACP methyl ester carboxylesterase
MVGVEPSLEYTETRDGARIAYSLAGQGPPLLRMQGGLWDHATGYWNVRPFAHQMARLAERYTQVMYDSRGIGLSRPGEADYRLEAQLRDVDAVVEALQLESFPILAHVTAGMAAITYSARYPEKVSKLILLQPHVRGEDYFNTIPMRALSGYRAMADEDWQGYLYTLTNRVVRFQDPSTATRLARLYDESMTPASLRLFEAHYRTLDVTHMLGAVMAQTLIIISKASTLGRDLWQEVAAGIHASRVVEVSGDYPIGWLDETTDAIETFLEQPTSEAVTE